MMTVVFRAGMLNAVGFTDGRQYLANEVSGTGRCLRITNDNGHERYVLVGEPCAHVDWNTAILPHGSIRRRYEVTPTPTVLLCGTFEEIRP